LGWTRCPRAKLLPCCLGRILPKGAGWPDVGGLRSPPGGVPGAGSNRGATVLRAVLAACEETGVEGRKTLTAYVAGVEVIFRIAVASHHSPEHVGFHAPGLTGVFGGAVVAGKLNDLDPERMANALACRVFEARKRSR